MNPPGARAGGASVGLGSPRQGQELVTQDRGAWKHQQL